MRVFAIVFTGAFLLSVHSFCQSKGKKILLEEFSTAPCGFCPDGDLIAAQLIKDHPQVIWVTHHAGFGTDSMTVPESVTIANAFTTFAPGAAIDRGDYKIPVYTIAPYIAVSRQKWDSICVSRLNEAPAVYLGITNDFNTTTRMLNCTVDATFSSQPADGDMRINIFLIEDSVSKIGKGYDQKNYMNGQYGHPYYQKGDTIKGYVHHHVIRKVLTGAWGVSGIIPTKPVVGTKYSKTFSNISIPISWKTKDMDVVAFVNYFNSKAALRPVINSNHKELLDATPAGISKESTVPTISVFPNPTSDKVFIEGEFGANKIGEFKVTNISGQVVNSYNLSNKISEFSTAELPNGIYFYTITGDKNRNATGKLVVIH